MGDYNKALEYSKLEKTTQGQIERQRDAPALLGADKNFYLGQMDNQVMEFRSRMYLLMVTGVCAFLIMLFFILMACRTHKKDQAEIQAHVDKYDELRIVLFARCDEYPKIEAEIFTL